MAFTGVTYVHGPSAQPTACRFPTCTVFWLQLEVTRPRAWFKPTLPEKSGVDGGVRGLFQLYLAFFIGSTANFNKCHLRVTLYRRFLHLFNSVSVMHLIWNVVQQTTAFQKWSKNGIVSKSWCESNPNYLSRFQHEPRDHHQEHRPLPFR